MKLIPFTAMNEEQLLRCRMVTATTESFMLATGHKPSIIYGSFEFWLPFDSSYLQLRGVRILFEPRLRGLSRYAPTAQLVD